MNDIFNNENAYKRLYAPIVIDGREVDAVVMPLAPDDPLAETAVSTDARVCDILIRRMGLGGWNDPANPPKIGAKVEIPAFAHDGFADCNLAVYATNVYDSENYLVKARTTKKSSIQ